jgi:hypothetical protein
MDMSHLTIGFHPVRNKRIEMAVFAELSRQLELFGDTAIAHAEAWAIVARTLPPAPMRKTLRLPKPTKNNDPAYRKVGAPALAIA